MVRQGCWELERDLFHRDIQLGADNSIIRDHEPVFDVGKPWWGQVEWVDRFYSISPQGTLGQMVHEKRQFFSDEVISAIRGPGFLAVRALQRSFRKKRYVQWYGESGAWDNFINDVVAFAACRGRVVRKSKISPFCPGPPWAYVPEPVVHAGAICVPAMGMLRDSEVRR